jgi:hypothetical protein
MKTEPKPLSENAKKVARAIRAVSEGVSPEEFIRQEALRAARLKVRVH